MSDDVNMGKWQGWKNTDRGKLKFLEGNFSETYFPHSGSYMDWFGIEPGLLRKEAGY
jgi:hypothetical protein